MVESEFNVLFQKRAGWVKKASICAQKGNLKNISNLSGQFNYVVLEGPSIKWRNKIPEDRVYYMGITKLENGGDYEGFLAAFPLDLQKAMLDYVLGVIQYPSELIRKIGEFQTILNKHKEKANTKEPILPPPQDKLGCFRELRLTDFRG